MTTLFRRRYVVTLDTTEPGLDLRDEICEALIEVESESIVRGIIELQGEEARVVDEKSADDLEAAEVGFAAMSEEDFAESQEDDDD